MQENHLFCFGLGYTASNLAEELLQQGWRVSGTCRTDEKCQSYKQKGIVAHVFDNDLPLMYPELLQEVTHILISIPPNDKGDIVLKYYKEQLQKLSHLKWIGYLSTTGVYGDSKGNWVNEDTPANPNTERSKKRAAAEADWQFTGLPVHIFRCAGIYGNQRSVINALQNGTARRINKKDQVFSRIHVQDLVQILLASILNPNPGTIYNCADDEPAPQADIVTYAAELLRVNPPPVIDFEKADLSEMAKSFYSSNRRVSNKKIKEELGVELKFPNYRLGIDDIIGQKLG